MTCFRKCIACAPEFTINQNSTREREVHRLKKHRGTQDFIFLKQITIFTLY